MGNSYPVYSYPDGNRAIYLDGPMTDSVVQEIADGGINRLAIVRWEPWKTKKLGPLHQAINELWLQSPEVPLGVADGFDGLRSLHVEADAGGFDFGSFPKLRECVLANQRAIPPSLARCRRLASVSFNDSKLSDLGVLAGLESLEKLVLGSVSAPPLATLGKLKCLRHLGLTRFQERDLGFFSGLGALESCILSLGSKLASLDGIEAAGGLKEVSLASCSKVSDLVPLATLAELRELTLESCPGLRSLRPLVKLKKLEAVHLWENSKVLDGDLRCLLAMPKLSELSFKDRKGYNLTQKEVAAAMS